ncbi:MAG: hypothetical protein RLZZ387_1614 [Chloroflexota bacterium]
MQLSSAPITHTDTAWLALSVPLWLTVAAALGATLLMRHELLAVLSTLLAQRSAERAADAALVWSPPVATPGQLLAAALASALAVTAGVTLLAPVSVAVALSPPAALVAIWIALRLLEARYIAGLERALPGAVGRLGGYLRGGASFQAAIERVIADTPPGPLQAEWSFLAERLAAPLSGGGRATPAQAVAALASQTPSRRHAVLLEHIEVALGQPHDVLARRVSAASAALLAAEQRRSQTETELAQMRYSGIAIGLSGTVMCIYLALTQPDRVARAYQGALGLVAGLAVAAALVAPIVAGVLLARADDADY